MTIREAQIKDIDAIYKLGENVEEFDTTEKVVTFWPKHILKNCIQSKTDWLLIAEEDFEIVGFIICNNSKVFNKAVIENIFVSPRYRNKGVGKKLLNSLMDYIRATDCEYVVIYTEEDNSKAIDFYLNNGFNRGKNHVWIDKVLSKEFRKS